MHTSRAQYYPAVNDTGPSTRDVKHALLLYRCGRGRYFDGFYCFRRTFRAVVRTALCATKAVRSIAKDIRLAFSSLHATRVHPTTKSRGRHRFETSISQGTLRIRINTPTVGDATRRAGQIQYCFQALNEGSNRFSRDVLFLDFECSEIRPECSYTIFTRQEFLKEIIL